MAKCNQLTSLPFKELNVKLTQAPQHTHRLGTKTTNTVKDERTEEKCSKEKVNSKQNQPSIQTTKQTFSITLVTATQYDSQQTKPCSTAMQPRSFTYGHKAQ